MSKEESGLFSVIILISLVFFVVALGLILLVAMYNRRRKLHFEEKNLMNQKFESELLKSQIEVQEQTMQTIASDLHDNIGQLLSLTTLTLNSIDLKEPEKSEKKIITSLDLVKKSIQELRDLAKLLQGEQIVELGLGKAIKQELDRLRRIGDYKLKVKNQLLDSAIFSPKKDLIILRLLQEIINNIIKHAKATHIEVDLSLIDETLHFVVAENGIGFDYELVKNQKKGLGLYSIHKRIELINGKIKVNSSQTTGTIIVIEIPYP
jgi:signal transduction histidine kinase